MKVKITRPDGTIIEAEGDAEEIQKLLPPPPVDWTKVFPVAPFVPVFPSPQIIPYPQIGDPPPWQPPTVWCGGTLKQE